MAILLYTQKYTEDFILDVYTFNVIVVYLQ